MGWWTCVAGVLVCAGLVGTAGGAPSTARPYEFVWANRTADDQPPLERMESAEGWRVETDHAVASVLSATDRALFGDGVVRLVYRADGVRPRVFG